MRGVVPEGKRWTVYTLADPDTDSVRYVGITTMKLNRRLTQHISEARRETRSWHTYKNRWVRQVLDSGKRPLIGAVFEGAGPGWQKAEQEWIRQYEANGCRLTNGTEGGAGLVGHKPSAATCLKISLANTGRKLDLSPEQRRAISERSRIMNTGRRWTEERKETYSQRLKGVPRPAHVIEKWHAKNKGKVLSDETKEKLRQAHLGMRASDATRKKMSEAHAGKTPNWTAEGRARTIEASKTRVLTAEQLDRMSKAQLGKHISQEHIQKLRDGHRRHYERIREAARESGRSAA